ncbi:MAG: hypothetical protein K8S99_06515 [Planctomycetes bacterium]|nr:hypothetical protein [Planctomycetota bacterium]
MPTTLTDYKGLQLPSPAPIQSGGLAIHNNFIALTDRIGPCNLSAVTDPGAADDAGGGYEVGSRWVNTVTGREFVCVNNAPGSAVWKVTTLPAGAQQPTAAWFGDGYDGAVTLSGATTLTRNMYYASLTINSGATLIPAGHRIHIAGSLVNNGTISAAGSAGSTGASPTGATGGAGGTSGATITGGDVPAQTTGGEGGPGGNAGNAGSSGVSPSSAVSYSCGNGGAGGDGGTSTGLGAGGGAAASGVQRPIRHMELRHSYAATLLRAGNGGAGGGGGGGAAAQGGNGGGGGGQGGGVVWIAAKSIANSGTITASGGNGGTGGSLAGGAGGAGGATAQPGTTGSAGDDGALLRLNSNANAWE